MATKKWLEVNRERILNYYKEYNKKHPERQKTYKKKVKEWFLGYKAALKCGMCGEADSACLDFHHRNPDEKVDNINWMFKNHWSIERIKTEIKKCDVVCANCHRKIHAKRIKRNIGFCDGEGI